MKRLKTLLLILMASAMLVACAGITTGPLADGYQIGDLSALAARDIAKLEQARRNYCDQTQGSELRAAALLAIQTQLPAYPANGVCSDLQALIAQTIGHSGEGTAIDPKARASPQ